MSTKFLSKMTAGVALGTAALLIGGPAIAYADGGFKPPEPVDEDQTNVGVQVADTFSGDVTQLIIQFNIDESNVTASVATAICADGEGTVSDSDLYEEVDTVEELVQVAIAAAACVGGADDVDDKKTWHWKDDKKDFKKKDWHKKDWHKKDFKKKDHFKHHFKDRFKTKSFFVK